MHIAHLRPELISFLVKRRLLKKFQKQSRLFEQNPFHPSLHTEILEPHHLKIYSFRVDRAYRAIFIYRDGGEIEIIDVNNHY